VIFVDTGGWFASVVPTDRDHDAANRWLSANREPLVTSDYVVDETLTLLRARGHQARAVALGEHLFSGRLARIHYLSPDEIIATWDLFRRFDDKDWSFTDCSSKVVMERLNVTTAFAFDYHFRQFGSVEVVPSQP
jgi:predicted nucleic acid-binding protein